MPLLISSTYPPGTLRDLEQPRLDVDGQLTLRPWHENDADAVRTAFDCPDIQRWHTRRMDTRDEALMWISNWTVGWAHETAASWAVVDNSDDRVVGQVGLRTISLWEASAQLSYWVVPQARGAGIAVRAALAVTRWTFDTVGLHRLFLQHSVANPASCRVATKLGYAVEGTARAALLHMDGWHDMHIHGRLRTD